MKTHNINAHADEDEDDEKSHPEPAAKKAKTMLNFLQSKQNLNEIVSSMAIDGILIRAITRNAFIRDSISKQGFKLMKVMSRS